MNDSEQLARTKLGMVNERHMDQSILLSAADLREVLRLLDEARYVSEARMAGLEVERAERQQDVERAARLAIWSDELRADLARVTAERERYSDYATEMAVAKGAVMDERDALAAKLARAEAALRAVYKKTRLAKALCATTEDNAGLLMVEAGELVYAYFAASEKEPRT